MNNTMQMIRTFFNRNKNPKDIAMQMIKNKNNPVVNNLINMAEKGDYKGVENFARNVFKEQGRNFDAELEEFKKMISEIK